MGIRAFADWPGNSIRAMDIVVAFAGVGIGADPSKQFHDNVKEAPCDRKPRGRPCMSRGMIDAIVKFLETLTDAPYRATAAKTGRASR
jgi:hypothetical protein